MAICHLPNHKEFSLIYTGYLTKNELSLEAKGLLSLIQALCGSDGCITTEQLVSYCLECQEEIELLMNELKDEHYLKWNDALNCFNVQPER